MKFLKLLTVLAISAMATSLFAANTAKAYVTFATVPATAGDDVYSDDVKLFEDDAEVLNTLDVSNNISDYCVNAYAIYNSINYSKVKIADLNGLVIKFKANNHDLNYKLTFSNVLATGKQIKLLNENGDTLVATEGNVYDIVCTSLNQELTFTVLMPQVYTREVANGAWGTICYDKKITAVAGADMYELAGTEKVGDVVTKVYVDPVNGDLMAGKAYLFNATADKQSFTYEGEAVTDSIQNNGLIGTLVGITTAADAWVIKGNVVMPAAAGSTVGQYRAYIADLNAIAPKPAAPGRRVFNVQNTPTMLEAVEAAAAKNGKAIINGQFVIVKDGKMYNAQGAEL